ncbi:transposase [Lachnospiraceae bacterium 62-35]
MITLEGYITAFEVTLASVDDREGLQDLVENRISLVILGDKGYTGESLFDEMQKEGICLMSLKPSNL